MIIKLTAVLLTALILVAIPGIIYGVVELLQYIEPTPWQVLAFVIGMALVPFVSLVTGLIYNTVRINLLDLEARWKGKL